MPPDQQTLAVISAPTPELAGTAPAAPVLLERGLLSRGRLFSETLRQARRTVPKPTAPTGRNKTRLASLMPAQPPIFILGCPRSGTTYLGSLLEALPGTSYYFEPQLLKYYARLTVEGHVSERHASFVYRATARSLLLAAPGKGPRFIEKNPNHVFAAHQLARIFPTARFVIITRDGRDVALSLLAKPWHRHDHLHSGRREPGGYLYGPHPHFYIEDERADEFRSTSDLHRCIWIWRQHQREIERLRSSLASDTQFHLRYESLVNDPESTLGGLLDHLDVPIDDRSEVLSEASRGHSGSVGRWRTEMSRADRSIVEAEAGSLLRELGYR